MIPTGRNQSVMSATTHQPGKMPLCLSFESIRSLNFLFVCVRTRPLLRAPEHSASGWWKVRVRIPAMREAEAGYNLRAATHAIGATVRSEHAKDLKRRNSSRSARSKGS